MPEEITTDSIDNVASARMLRRNMQQSESEQATLRLFNLFGFSLFEKGWSAESAQLILNEACNQFGAQHGMIAKQDGGTLNVIAKLGKTFPTGSRIPIMGGLGTLLKSPCKFHVNKEANALWSFNKDDAFTTFTMPIAYQHQPLGILALASIKTLLTKENITTLHSLAGLLGTSIALSENKSSSTVDLSELDVLTPREREVFALLPSGHSNAELAALLEIASGTVKVHVERILNKLSLRDRTQAAVKAVELGFKS